VISDGSQLELALGELYAKTRGIKISGTKGVGELQTVGRVLSFEEERSLRIRKGEKNREFVLAKWMGGVSLQKCRK